MSGRLRVAGVIVVVSLLAILSGCGGSGRHHGGGMMDGSTGMTNGHQATMPARSATVPTPTATAPSSEEAAGNGRALFLASGCGGCHTLAAAGTTGTAGPNLDQTRPSDARVTQRVTEGGNGMPSFAGSLTAV